MQLSREESFDLLNEYVELIGEPRPNVSELPRHDDEQPGPSIFRSLLEDVSFKNTTLPGLFIGRSELRNVSFEGDDLHLR